MKFNSLHFRKHICCHGMTEILGVCALFFMGLEKKQHYDAEDVYYCWLPNTWLRLYIKKNIVICIKVYKTNKTFCYGNLIKWFSQVFINFGRVWLAEPDYKCKIRNTRNKAQLSKSSRNTIRDISVNKNMNAEEEGINRGKKKIWSQKKKKYL